MILLKIFKTGDYKNRLSWYALGVTVYPIKRYVCGVALPLTMNVKIPFTEFSTEVKS